MESARELFIQYNEPMLVTCTMPARSNGVAVTVGGVMITQRKRSGRHMLHPIVTGRNTVAPIDRSLRASGPRRDGT